MSSYIEKKISNGVAYYYLAKKKYDSKTKNSVRVALIPLGSINTIEEKINSPKPKKANAKTFGNVFAVYETMKEVGIDKIIESLPLSEKEAKLLQLSIINRATHPTSKNKLGDWFEKTSLFKLYSIPKKELNSVNYSRLMKKVNEENVEKALEALLTNLQNLGIKTDDIIFDNSNYTTRLQKNQRLNIAQLGKPKNGKWGNLQINLHLLVTRDGNIPVYYRPYQGNINDPTFFEMNREKLIALSSHFNIEKKKVTLSLDAGHNSEDNIKEVDQNYQFVGTLRPSMCKDLIEKPSTEFTKKINLEKNEFIKIHSEKRKIYGKEYFVIVSQFSATQKKSGYTLDENIEQTIKKLKSFEQDINATFRAEKEDPKKRKTKFHDKEKIKKHVEHILSKKKHIKEIVTAEIELKDNIISIKVVVDQQHQSKIKDQLGRAIRFTNRDDLTPEEVIEYYQEQYMVEHQFRDLKSPHLTAIMPMFHHTDETIKTFLFTNYLALVILSYMERKLKKELKISFSKATMLEYLENMREIILAFENKITSIISEKENEFQEKMYKIFNLEHYYQMEL